MEKETEITDVQVFGDKVWLAGRDGSVYLCLNTGVAQDRISSGLTWIGRIAPGPDGKVLVAGGSKEGFFEAVSLISSQSYQSLPAFPVITSSSEGYKLGFSPGDNSIYCGVNNQLYRTVSGANAWEKVTEFGNWINEILVSPQGLYVFIKPQQVYFSRFPIGDSSQWVQVDIEELKGSSSWLGCRLAEANGGKDTLIFWDTSRIIAFSYQPDSEPEEDVQTTPVTTPETVEPRTFVTPTPTPTPTPDSTPATQPPVSMPSIDWSQIWIWIFVVVGAVILTFVLIAVFAR